MIKLVVLAIKVLGWTLVAIVIAIAAGGGWHKDC